MEQLLGFSWAELLWCHKWSWWCLWTLHSQHILLVHSAAPSTPHPPRPHTHCQHQDLPSSPPHLSVSKIRRAELKTGDAARQVSFLKHPTLVSMQRWPKTDINNRSLINLYRSSTQEFPSSLCLSARWHSLLRALFNTLDVQSVVKAKDWACGGEQMKGKQCVYLNITCVEAFTELAA